MVALRGKRLVVFWTVIAIILVVASYIMFLGFNPRIGNPLVTVLAIVLIYAVGFVGVWHRFRRRGF
jgi:CHASE2 domain-containing sensor protein